MTSPVGGEQWLPDSLHSIIWQTVGVASVDVEVSRDGGATWDVIAASVDAAAGSCTWLVAGPVSGQCRIRVSDAADGAPVGTSPADFRIGLPEEAFAEPFLGDGCVHGGGTSGSAPLVCGIWLTCLAALAALAAVAVRRRVVRTKSSTRPGCRGRA